MFPYTDLSSLVPLAVPMLFDKSSFVRRGAAVCLWPWSSDVPLQKAIHALLEEKVARNRWYIENLLKCILCSIEGGEQPENYIWR